MGEQRPDDYRGHRDGEGHAHWQAPGEPTGAERRIGRNPTGRDADNDAKGAGDSFLGI